MEDEAEILEEFIQESREHLAAIEPDLLEMERQGSETASEIVNRVFRAIHSTKGGASFLAFDALKEFSHLMENVLMLIRDGKLAIAPTVIDALLRGVDVLRRMVDDVKASDKVDCSAERALLDALIRVSVAPIAVAIVAPTAPTVVATMPPADALHVATANVDETPSVSPLRAATTAVGVAEAEPLSAERAELNAVVRAAIAHGHRIFRLELDEQSDLIDQKSNVELFVATCGSVGKVLARRCDAGAPATAGGRKVLRLVLASVLDKHLLLAALGVQESRIKLLDKATLLSATGLSEEVLAVSGAVSEGSVQASSRQDIVAQTSIATAATSATRPTSASGSKRSETEGPVPVAFTTPPGPNSIGFAPAPARASAPRPEAAENLMSPIQADGRTSVATALTRVAQGPANKASGGKDGVSDSNETLRVRVELLNQLMDSASELVLGRNQLLRAMKDQADKSTGIGIILQHIDRVTTDLQEGIMQTRMQQIGSLFSRYGRVARDLGRQLGKNVELRSEGNHVELDKSIIEALADPLTHIVRNAVDHAIETPEERRRCKKPEVGRVLLSASHESGQVKIVIEDDGRGIDRVKVLRKAIEKGLLTPAAAEKITERDVVNLLMLPGFSTAERVSDVSGRGVGMDVVRTNVESLGGQIEIESELGFGTSVQLRLPLTLAIIPSLIVGSGGARFAVPQVSIVELVWVRADDESERVQSLHGSLMLRLRGRLLPLIKVSDVLGGHPQTTTVVASSGVERKDHYILVLRAGTESFGLIVDELFESEEIVVKPLPQFLKGIDCFAGTTILGDGSVTMILDPSGLASRAGLRFAAASAAEAAAAEEARAIATSKRSVIVFAGSPTEQYLVPQEKVLRLERIARADMQRAGGKDYVCYRGLGLPLVRLEDYLPVTGVPEFAEEVFLLIPRMVPGRAVEPAAGILVWRIIDAVDLDLKIQEPLFDGPGVSGATLIDGVLTTILDPVALVHAAQPRKGRAA